MPTPPRSSVSHDRGTLQPGRRADLNLVDLAAVGSTAPTLVDDLPGGGSRLVSRGIGYVATIVRGAGHVRTRRAQRNDGRCARPCLKERTSSRAIHLILTSKEPK